MKVGVNVLLWTANLNQVDHPDLLKKIADMGFGVFETSVGDMSASDVEFFAKQGVALGLEPQCTDLFDVSVADIISPDKAMRDKAVARYQTSIKKTRDMGATLMCGPFIQALRGSTLVGPTQQEWDWAVENLRTCAITAKECGIRLAAEPLNHFEMYLLNTIADAARMCDDIGMDNFGILADTHHSNIEELDLVGTYVKYIDKIFNVHISESNRGIPGSGHGVPTALFGALEQANYTGNLVIEAFNANVPETLPLLNIWRPFADTEEEIAQKGLAFINSHIHH